MLDRILTVAIGRNDKAGTPLTDLQWRYFHAAVRNALDDCGTLVAVAGGRGIGSDGVNDGAPEDTSIFIVVNPRDVETLRADIGYILQRFNSSSAAFAYDIAHEPVFATATGYRSPSSE